MTWLRGSHPGPGIERLQVQILVQAITQLIFIFSLKGWWTQHPVRQEREREEGQIQRGGGGVVKGGNKKQKTREAHTEN